VEYDGFEEAEDYASKAAAKGEKVDSLMAHVYWHTGRWWNALPIFQKLAQASPKDEHLKRIVADLERRTQDSRSIIGQADAAMKEGDPSKAAQLARIALASKLHGVRIRLVLAAASLRTFGYADALAQFLAVLDVDPKNAEALVGRKQAEDGLTRTRNARMRRLSP
jgi:tetratricopeptide (TPR) repeat protein